MDDKAAGHVATMLVRFGTNGGTPVAALFLEGAAEPLCTMQVVGELTRERCLAITRRYLELAQECYSDGGRMESSIELVDLDDGNNIVRGTVQ